MGMRRQKHTCFPPFGRPDARVLILGSLPGRMSLERQQYYAHPQNSFWKIMGRLLDFSPVDRPYEQRRKIILDSGIAIWDVCAAAHRKGSLDTAIKNIEANDFAAFYATHPQIQLVCFNGQKAETIYQKKVGTVHAPGVEFRRLPSTSPAHAGMTFEKKFQAWSELLQVYLPKVLTSKR
jgi:hypoxanthine-DNA glycosylase